LFLPLPKLVCLAFDPLLIVMMSLLGSQKQSLHRDAPAGAEYPDRSLFVRAPNTCGAETGLVLSIPVVLHPTRYVV
jgi:hypothetical protein